MSISWLEQTPHVQEIVMNRFWSKVDKTDTCWLWNGATEKGGYGILHTRKAYGTGYVKVHRLSYEVHFGNIPKGLWVLHSCDNPPCVNPNHLSLGTHKDNMRQMSNRSRSVRGSASNFAKLDTGTVLEIRHRYSQGGILQKELAAEFGVSISCISNIVTNDTWGYLV